MTKEFKEPREKDNEKGRPNILMIMVDQLSYPGYESGGFHEGIKKILGFKPMTPQEAEEYGAHFPGFMALRKNSVALNNHRIAAAACVPSRTAIPANMAREVAPTRPMVFLKTVLLTIFPGSIQLTCQRLVVTCVQLNIPRITLENGISLERRLRALKSMDFQIGN